MSTDMPSQYQAAQELAEVTGRAASIRRADRPLAVALLALAVLYVVVGVVAAIGPGPASALALGTVFVAGLASVVIVLSRRRASSRIGARVYANSIAVFLLWNAAVIAGSTGFGWWAPHTPGWHFTLSAAVAAMPLFLAAGVLVRRSR